MAIVRIPKVNNYTIMSNHHLTDPNLSLKAKGLMSYMLSRPDNWDFTIEGLARQNMEGADAIARIIRELEGRGYVIRSRTRNKAGKFTDMEYRILECPREMTNLETITEENTPVPAHDEPIPDRPIPNSPNGSRAAARRRSTASRASPRTSTPRRRSCCGTWPRQPPPCGRCCG